MLVVLLAVNMDAISANDPHQSSDGQPVLCEQYLAQWVEILSK